MSSIKEKMTPSSTNKVHRVATDKLRELEFDPIEEILKAIQEIDAMILKEKLDNTPRPRLLADLITQRASLLSTILPYRYGKAPVVTIEDDDYRDPIKIILEME